MTRRVGRGASGVHSAHLLRLNQRAAPNVVVEGGSEPERVEVMRELHRSSPLANAPFCATHATRDHDRLLASLYHWLGHADGPPELNCAGGTLYVDDPGALSLLVQKLLYDHCERTEEPRCFGGPVRGPVRLAAGGSHNLSDDVASGRLLPALHDTLDKFRIRLGACRRLHP